MNLPRTNAVLAVVQQPAGRQPLFERNRRILKERADLERELTARMLVLTVPEACILEVAYISGPAVRATHLAIRPAGLDHKLLAAVEVAEVDDCFAQCLYVFHAPNVAGKRPIQSSILLHLLADVFP